MMVPEFPIFKNLEIGDRKVIENFTKQFPPYTEYTFTSLWIGDTFGKTQFSFLNGNLVIKLDYITGRFHRGEEFYSFLGNQLFVPTVKTLMDFSKTKGYKQKLGLVPEHAIQADRVKPRFITTEDYDNADYIYSTDKLSRYEGHEYSDLRNLKNRFIRRHGTDSQITLLDLKNKGNQTKIWKLSDRWDKYKGYRKDRGTDALMRLLLMASYTPFISVGIFVKDELVAYSISEQLKQKNWGITHITQADVQYVGVYAYLMHNVANVLTSRGITFLNYGQDLGKENLKRAKTAFRPVFFLKKYLIQEKLYE